MFEVLAVNKRKPNCLKSNTSETIGEEQVYITAYNGCGFHSWTF